DTWSLGVGSASAPQNAFYGASLNGFSFEGQCVTSPLKGLHVYGEFEDRRGLLCSLPSTWTSMPSLANAIVEGWGDIRGIDRHGPAFPPTCHFHLFCTPEGLEWVYRAFLAAFVISQNSLWPLCLFLDIEPPDAGQDISDEQPVEDFWRERWQSEPWRVV